MSGKWRPFCLALNVLTNLSNMLHASSILPFILSIYFLLNVSLQTASKIEYLWVGWDLPSLSYGLM